MIMSLLLENVVTVLPRFVFKFSGFVGFVATNTLFNFKTYEFTCYFVDWFFCFQGTQAEWQNVFYLCCGILAAGLLAYLAMASGEMQDWAKDETADNPQLKHTLIEKDKNKALMVWLSVKFTVNLLQYGIVWMCKICVRKYVMI